MAVAGLALARSELVRMNYRRRTRHGCYSVIIADSSVPVP